MNRRGKFLASAALPGVLAIGVATQAMLTTTTDPAPCT